MKKIILSLLLGAVASLNGADFNHDGHQDYLLANNTNNQLAIWHLVGLNFVSGVYGPTIPAGWTIVGTGDFNHDGYPDLLLFNATTGQTAIWYLRDGTLLYGVYGPQFINGFVPMVVDDMNNDGNPDILAFNPNTRALWVVLMGGNTESFSQIGPPKTTQLRAAVAAESEAPQQTILGQYVLATIAPNWAIVESANHQITFINTSTFQTANWVIGFNPALPNPFFISYTFLGPNVPAGWQLVDSMDFNLDGWNDYLLGGAFGRTAVWNLDNVGHLLRGAYGPTIPAGFSFAKQHFKTCSFGVAPTARTVSGSSSSFFQVNVVTEFGCTWYYHSNTAWIHVSTGTQPRIGSGSIGVTVDAGPAGVGTITVAGQTITITRTGPTSPGWIGTWNGTISGRWYYDEAYSCTVPATSPFSITITSEIDVEGSGYISAVPTIDFATCTQIGTHPYSDTLGGSYFTNNILFHMSGLYFFSGTRNGNTITGTVSGVIQDGTGTFTVTKQ